MGRLTCACCHPPSPGSGWEAAAGRGVAATAAGEEQVEEEVEMETEKPLAGGVRSEAGGAEGNSK